jgi:hypothetical protein
MKLLTNKLFEIFLTWHYLSVLPRSSVLVYNPHLFYILGIFLTSNTFCITSQILWRCGDSVELLDVSNELPELARRPGLSTWKVSIDVPYIIHAFFITLQPDLLLYNFIIKCGIL